MSDETQPEPITYLLRHSGCISGPTECCFEVAIQKALNMPLRTEVVELYEWPEELITRLRADLAAANTRMSKLDFERTAAELERDALAARLAPVEDEALVEIAAHFEAKFDGWPFNVLERLTQDLYRLRARDFLAAIRPHIEAAERERCAKIAEGSFLFDIETWLNSTKKEMTAHVAKAIAAAIRSGK